MCRKSDVSEIRCRNRYVCELTRLNGRTCSLPCRVEGKGIAGFSDHQAPWDGGRARCADRKPP